MSASKTILLAVLLLLLAGCTGSISKEEKARMLVHEWNAKNLDEANYSSKNFRDFIEWEDEKNPAIAYRITHRFYYGNKGREREYYYFLDSTITDVVKRKRSDWDKSQ